MEIKPKLEFQKGMTYKVTLLFDSAKSGKNGKGNDWYLYGVNHEMVEKNFFANDYALHNKVKEFSRGDIIEIIDKDETENPWAHDWHVTPVGKTQLPSGPTKTDKNNTSTKIEVYASMKIAGTISNNLDELKINTHGVIALHKEICETIENEKDLF